MCIPLLSTHLSCSALERASPDKVIRMEYATNRVGCSFILNFLHTLLLFTIRHASILFILEALDTINQTTTTTPTKNRVAVYEKILKNHVQNNYWPWFKVKLKRKNIVGHRDLSLVRLKDTTIKPRENK